jgi:hypothetical protein
MGGTFEMKTEITAINEKGRLERLGERGLTILGTVGCFETYLVALTYEPFCRSQQRSVCP